MYGNFKENLLFLGVRMFMAYVFIQHEIKYEGKINWEQK